jgi:hypothetical protein
VVGVVLGDALLAVTAAAGFIEAPDMTRALAAAAIVALFTSPNAPFPDSLNRSWFDSVRLEPSHALRAKATQVFARALQPNDNEWYALWAEVDSLEEVRAGLVPYISVLA